MMMMKAVKKMSDQILNVSASAEDSGTRLDAFIGYNTDELSRSYAVKLIESGRVSVNGETVTSKKRAVSEGDTVSIYLPEPEPLEITAEDIPLEIVYEDDAVAVINKPRGMVVHPGPGNQSGTLVNAIMYHMGDSLSSINGVIRPGIVHRIDKDTSGLLMIAKNNKAHESLAAQLKEHSVTREYTALYKSPGALRKVYPHQSQAGDRQNAPDQSPHGLRASPSRRRRAVWSEKAVS